MTYDPVASGIGVGGGANMGTNRGMSFPGAGSAMHQAANLAAGAGGAGGMGDMDPRLRDSRASKKIGFKDWRRR